MTDPTPAAPAPGGAPGSEAPPSVRARGARPSRARRLVALADRVPTGWFASILTAVFLGVTAAFGGLAAVAVPPVPELTAGDTHENALFSLTVERAVLIDDLLEAGISVDDGERVLALVVTAENNWDRAVSSVGDTGVAGSIGVAELDGQPATSIARFDDTTSSPYLQPGLPVQLVLAWAVDAEQFTAGDELHLDLRDFSLYTGQLITYGQSWENPVTAAHVTVPITDVGAGASSADGAGG